jgi:rhamnose transport system ATP-binding protein
MDGYFMDCKLIEVNGISKAFGGVQALDGVSLDMAPGEIHALVGENGAGKSTLIKILAGTYTPDKGEVTVNGKKIHTGDVRASEDAGIAVIHQESTAFLHLNAVDNIFVGREPLRCMGMLLDRFLMVNHTKELLERLGEDLNPMQPVGELPLAQRQMVGIARALSKQSKLLIMDEPTASLSTRETETLFKIIRQLQSDGVGILYVSHRLEEVFELADKVTVLRDGHTVDTLPIDKVTRASLIQMMVGREVTETSSEGSKSAETGQVVLEVENLGREGVFQGVSLQVKAGEVVGLAGLVGAGRSEVARAIFGVDKYTNGSVKVDGSALISGSVKEAVNKGIALVPEDRQHEGLVLPMTIMDNLSLVIQNRLTRWGLRSSQREAELAERTMHDLDVRASNAYVPAESLSGGNQQKLVIGKWLASSPKVLILDEPTRGIDVGAKTEVHKMIRKLADDGLAVLFISSDLPEVLAMSDRIIVMRAGTVAGELKREEATQERVLELALAESRESSQTDKLAGGVE